MRNISFSTGRTYDADQVLEITVLDDLEDEFGLRDVSATFVDASRHIKGKLDVVVFLDETIGEAVLKAYDAGNYQSI
jgi:hypothetical protein